LKSNISDSTNGANLIIERNIKLKILKPTAYYFPENVASSHLSNDLEIELFNENIEIKIITPMPTRGISEEIRKIYKKNKIESKADGKIEIIRFNLFREKKCVIFRAIRYLISILKQYQIGKRQKDIDLIFAESTPPIQGVLGVWLKKKLNVPFVYVVQDVFPDSLLNTRIIKRKGIIWFIGRTIENYIYKNADKIIVISNDFKNNLLDKNVPNDKLTVINNWIDTEIVRHIEKDDNKLFDKYKISRDKFIVSYCGNLGMTQNLEMVIEAAEKLRNFEDILFVFVGEGSNKGKLVDLSMRQQLTNIIFIPFQPYADISQVFSLADVGLVVSKPNVGSNSVPSKAFTILAASQPILASFDVESELCKVITDHNCGFCVDPNDIEQFLAKLLKMYKERITTRRMGQNGRDLMESMYSKNINTRKYIDLFISLMS